MKRARTNSESGQVWTIVAASIAVILGVVGVATDLGLVQLERQKMQSAADSAALAGAAEVNYGDVTSAARADAASNGYPNDGAVTVAVNNPPTAGQYSGNAKYVEVVVTKNERTFFLAALGTSNVSVAARAVAGQANSSGCIYALDPAASGAVLINGNATVTSSCGLIVDSSSSSAMILNGNITLDATTGIVGNYTKNGNVTVSPTPKTGIIATGDPLAYVNPPTVGSCNYTNYSLNGNKTVTLSPGVYCGGISMNGNVNVTFSSGTYILDGGGMSVNGNATLSGSGVTFYNTQGYSSYGAITINGNAQVNLSAPTSGSMEAMLFFQDRSISSTSGSILNGNSSSTWDGAIYFPSSPLTFNGNSSVNGYTIVVGDKITVNGNSTVGSDYSSLADGSPIRTVVLAE